MVQTPLKPRRLSLKLPEETLLQVSPAQFDRLAVANRELRLARSATGDLIVNLLTRWEMGDRSSSVTTQLGRWYEDQGEPENFSDPKELARYREHSRQHSLR